MKIVPHFNISVVVGLKKRDIECAVGHPVKGGGGVDSVCLIEINGTFCEIFNIKI